MKPEDMTLADLPGCPYGAPLLDVLRAMERDEDWSVVVQNRGGGWVLRVHVATYAVGWQIASLFGVTDSEDRSAATASWVGTIRDDGGDCRVWVFSPVPGPTAVDRLRQLADEVDAAGEHAEAEQVRELAAEMEAGQ